MTNEELEQFRKKKLKRGVTTIAICAVAFFIGLIMVVFGKAVIFGAILAGFSPIGMMLSIPSLSIGLTKPKSELTDYQISAVAPVLKQLKKEILEDDNFVVCEICGNKSPKDSCFCNACGKELSKK